MFKAVTIIYACIALDALGIGLIFPILPQLLASLTQASEAATAMGIIGALYALMQFLFAPLLGAISDRVGRRPVLLFSMAGATINYLLMAYTGQFALLLVGRAIAGLSSANISVAMAYLSDITPVEQRARRFGMFNAVFGAGFILGPIVGGVLGDYALKLPFLLAAMLTAGNFLLALLALPETRTPQKFKLELHQLNPLQPLRWILQIKQLTPVIVLFFILSLIGEVYGTCWALWGQQVFHWNGLWIGISLACFGLCQSLAQASLPGLAVRYLGERRTILLGFSATCIALICMAWAKQGWLVFSVMPMFVMASVGVPALQALASRMVEDSQQGQFQGVIAAVVSLAAIIGPLLFSTLYLLLQTHWPGAIWLSVVALYLLATPLVLRLRF